MTCLSLKAPGGVGQVLLAPAQAVNGAAAALVRMRSCVLVYPSFDPVGVSGGSFTEPELATSGIWLVACKVSQYKERNFL